MFFYLILPLISAITIYNFDEKVKILFLAEVVSVFLIDLTLASATETRGKWLALLKVYTCSYLLFNSISAILNIK